MSEVKWWGSDEVEWNGKRIEFDFPHVVHSQQFSLADSKRIFKLTAILKKQVLHRTKKDWLYGCIIMDLLYEPSTRTGTSFAVAGIRLGADIIMPPNPKVLSSMFKGETLEDSIHIYADKVDLIVLRHEDDSSSFRATRPRFCQDTPIINAGAGKGQHPTQALLDVYTIEEKFGEIAKLKVGVCGDLKYGRASRSLVYQLSKYPEIDLYLIAPAVAQMDQDVLDYLTRHNVKWQKCETLKEVISFLDVCYMTRFQTEREDPEEKEIMEKASMINVIDGPMADSMKDEAIILHPLPRKHEIRYEVDKNKRAFYFLQAFNGDYVRMALLLMILNPQKAEELLNS